jgi:hypothetical protein
MIEYNSTNYTIEIWDGISANHILMTLERNLDTEEDRII